MAAHGLGPSFLRAVLQRLPASYSVGFSKEYEVRTEFRDGHSRFDILLLPAKPLPGRKGLVIENKVKSFGSHVQLDGYKEQGYNVAVFALLPETLDEDVRAKYPVIEYKALREIIAATPLNQHNGYEFFVSQYTEFLDHSVLQKHTAKEFNMN